MKFLLLASAALALAAPAAAVTNLVANGRCENGIAGWTVGGVDTDSSRPGGYPPAAIFYGAAQPYPTGAFGEAVAADNSVSLSPDAVGGRAAYFVSDFTVNQSLTQSVFLPVGSYAVGFSAYAPANGYSNAGDARFSGTIAGVTLASYLVSTGPVTSWQHFTGVANIVQAGNYDVAFLFNTNLAPSKDVVIDRVYIIATTDDGGPDIPVVPEPATWAMMIAGFGLVGASLRGRNRARVSA